MIRHGGGHVLWRGGSSSCTWTESTTTVLTVITVVIAVLVAGMVVGVV